MRWDYGVERNGKNGKRFGYFGQRFGRVGVGTTSGATVFHVITVTGLKFFLGAGFGLMFLRITFMQSEIVDFS
jgi:hypothetical protein